MKLSKNDLRKIIFATLSEAVRRRGEEGDTSFDSSAGKSSVKDKDPDLGKNRGEKKFGRISIKHVYSKTDMKNKNKKVKGLISVTGGNFFKKYPMTYVHEVSRIDGSIESKARVKVGGEKPVEVKSFEKKKEYFEKLKKVAGRRGYRYFVTVMKQYAGLIVTNEYDVNPDAKYLIDAKIKVKEPEKKPDDKKKSGDEK